VSSKKEEIMLKKGILLTCLIGFIALSAWPSVQGKIEGKVTDKAGNPLEKVEVTITSVQATSRYFKVKTDKEGKFTQIGIWPGYYQVDFKKSGFQTVSVEVRVSIAESTKMNISMEKIEKAAEKLLTGADKSFLDGYKLYEEEKYEEAARAYEEAIKLNPTQWGYYFNLGLAYKKLGKKEETLAAFQKAVELNQESYSSRKELGEALAKDEKYDEAKKHYMKATELSPDDPDGFYNLGVVSTNLGESEEALKSYLKTVELKEDYADAYYQIGTIYIGQNNSDEAIKSLEKFLEIAPEHEKASIANQLLDYLKKK